MTREGPTSPGRIAALGAVAALVFVAACGPGEGQPVSEFPFTPPPASDAGPDEVDADDDRDTEGDGAPTGAACEYADQCAGDRCLPPDSYPDGYCTRLGCRPGECSGSNAICVRFESDARRCLKGCSSHGACRQGYSCQSVGNGGQRACLPGTPPPPKSFEATRKALEVQCDPEKLGLNGGHREYRFEFQIDRKTDSFLMVPYVADGGVQPIEMSLPNSTVDIQHGYRHHNPRVSEVFGGTDLAGAGTYGAVAFAWPILVPYAPQYDSYVRPGERYELLVETDRKKPCLYVLEKRSGVQLDLNFYFVGAGGLAPGAAKRDDDFQAALRWMEHIYGKIGVELGELRYYGFPDDLEDRFEVVTSREEADRLTAHGKPPTERLAGHLSVDVFLVDDLELDNRAGQAVNVLGMSAGVPGAAGLHGNARNGLIFQVSDLGFDNKHVGLIMAHEIGHFLGLRHTTEVVHDTVQGDRIEQLYGTTDPVADTPVCSEIYDKIRRNPRNCDDYQNLMFPLAPPAEDDQDPKLTPGQGEAMRANPLITDR